MKKKFAFTASGDALIVKRIPKDYAGFQEVSDYLMKGDARITNLETTLNVGHTYASQFSGGTWLTAKPEVLKDLKDYGFNLFSCANNHALDYSYAGLQSTIKEMDKEGVAFAGIGDNLQKASEPAVIYTESGSAALISVCSTYNPSAAAGNSTSILPGRPGLNMLRYKTVYTVKKEKLEVLKDIAETCFVNAAYNKSLEEGMEYPEPDFYRFGDLLFQEGAEEGRYSFAESADIERVTSEICRAKVFYDYVVVSIHSHEIKYNSRTQPDFFVEQFARACIDAGACAVIGGGTHQLKGIEIYKNAPIFYSLGNFIFYNEYVEYLPADYMEKYHLPIDCSTEDAIRYRKEISIGTNMHKNPLNYYSVISYFEIGDEGCSYIELQPIELGFYKEREFRNIPYLATDTVTEYIFKYLKEASRNYGTKVEMKNGKIIINLMF